MHGVWRALQVQAFPACRPDRAHGQHVRGDRTAAAAMGRTYAIRPMPLREMVDRRRAQLVEMSEGVHLVVWMDNFNCLKYAPVPMSVNRSLDATAFCFLHVPAFQLFRGHATLSDLVLRAPGLADELVSSVGELEVYVQRITRYKPTRTDVRVPLDIRRVAVRSLPWQPCTLGPWRVGSGIGLLHGLKWLRGLPALTAPRPDVPLLVDSDIYHRIQKMLYSHSYLRWDCDWWLRRHPLIWGVWHSYKHCCYSVFRAFMPHFGYLSQELEPASVPRLRCRPQLVYIERMIMALLLQPSEVLDQLRHAAVLTAANADRRPTDVVLRSSAKACESLVVLLTVYVPAVYHLGFMVREATWAGRTRGTGKLSRKTLLYSTVVLLGLRQAKAIPYDIYVNAHVPALLAEQPIIGTVVGAAHSEESCEAMLSRFAKHWGEHPSATTVEMVSDLFATLPHVSVTVADRANNVPQALVDSVGDLLPGLATSLILNDRPWHVYRPRVVYVLPVSPLTSTTRWPAPRLGITLAEAQDVVGSALGNAVSSAVITPQMEAWLDKHILRRTTAACTAQLRILGALLPTERHLGQVRAPPRPVYGPEEGPAEYSGDEAYGSDEIVDEDLVDLTQVSDEE